MLQQGYVLKSVSTSVSLLSKLQIPEGSIILFVSLVPGTLPSSTSD